MQKSTWIPLLCLIRELKENEKLPNLHAMKEVAVVDWNLTKIVSLTGPNGDPSLNALPGVVVVVGDR